MIWMVSGITFGVTAAIILGIWILYTGETTQEVVRGRIEQLRAAQNWTGIAADLKLVRDEMFSTIPVLHRVLADAPGAAWARNFISQSGLKTKPAKLFLLSVVIAFFTYLIVVQYVPIYLALPSGLLASLLPLAVVAFTRRKRLNLFEERFPDALDMLGRAVRAGHAFTSALELIAQESPEPIAGEFAITFEEQNYGIPVRDALEHLADRVPLIERPLSGHGADHSKGQRRKSCRDSGSAVPCDPGALPDLSGCQNENGTGAPDGGNPDHAAVRHAGADVVSRT